MPKNTKSKKSNPREWKMTYLFEKISEKKIADIFEKTAVELEKKAKGQVRFGSLKPLV